MIKKGGFSISEGMSKDLTNTMDFVRNNVGTMNYRSVPISAIEFDPHNPRKLSISRDDVISGLNKDADFYDLKLKELTSLQEMAETIKQHGVRNPVEIYKHGSTYRLIHGERRCLGSLLAGKTDIPAKILEQKPSNLDIRLLQLIENVQREDLSLSDFLDNIRLIVDEYKISTKEDFVLNANFLEKMINKSRAQCFNILAVLNAPEEIQRLIREGKIKNLEKAALISTEKVSSKRLELLDACIKGESLKKLKQMKSDSQKTNLKHEFNNEQILKPGRKTLKVRLGNTTSKQVISKLISLVLQDPNYSTYRSILNTLNTHDYDSCTISFEKLITIMEKVEVNNSK